MLQLVRIFEDLPEGFDALRAEAEAEGERNLTRLAVEWAQDASIFQPLLAAFRDGALVGVGALTAEPAAPDAMRLRRLYVARAARRQGVGRTLAGALMLEGLAQSPRLTVHAGSATAAAFWEAMGFRPVAGFSWSHVLARG